MDVEVYSAFYLCQAFEYAMPVDDEDAVFSCEQCANIDGAEGLDCELPGATLASLPVREGFWRSSRESLIIHQCAFIIRLVLVQLRFRAHRTTAATGTRVHVSEVPLLRRLIN